MDKEYKPEQKEVMHANALERLREFTGKDNRIDINNVITILADFKTELQKELTDKDQMIEALEGDIVLLQAKKDKLAKDLVQLAIQRQVPKKKNSGGKGDYLTSGLNMN